MLGVTKEVNQKLRADLLSAFLNSKTSVDPVVEALCWDLLLNEARLLSLGERRPLLQKVQSPWELPARLLEEVTGQSFAPYAPLAGQTFAR